MCVRGRHFTCRGARECVPLGLMPALDCTPGARSSVVLYKHSRYDFTKYVSIPAREGTNCGLTGDVVNASCQCRMGHLVDL